jgi:RNA polymerase sigma factor (sigma-70 family)
VANERRKRARRSRLISNEIAESLLSAADRAPDPLELHEQRELAVAVRDCLSKLPRRGQDLLSLRYFEGLGPGTIASLTQQPSNRVRQSLMRWRRLLGDCIEKRMKLKVL